MLFKNALGKSKATWLFRKYRRAGQFYNTDFFGVGFVVPPQAE